MPTKLSHEVLSAAIEGFEAQKARIDAQIAELRAMLSGGSTEPAPAAKLEPPKRKRRKMSAAGRRAMSEAMKMRWAAFHAAKQLEKPAVKPATASKAVPKKAAVKAAVKAAIKTPVKTAKKTAAKKQPKKAAKAHAAVAPAAAQ